MRPAMMKCLSAVAASALAIGILPWTAAADVVDFEDVGAALGMGSYWNGSDLSGTFIPGGGPYGDDIYDGGFNSGPLFFNNVYTPAYGSWAGWSYSNMTDTTTPGYVNQYSAMTGGGAGGSATYGVQYGSSQGDAMIDIPAGYDISSAMITNTTYAYLAIRDGDDGVPIPPGPYVREFTTDDWFKLEIFGYDGSTQIGSVEFYLANYAGYIPGTSNDDDFIVTDWTEVDLSTLAGSTRLEFALSSTDNSYGSISTPAYFAIDNITLVTSQGVPEPSTLLLAALGAVLLLAWRRRALRRRVGTR